jgi:hypothetical protein
MGKGELLRESRVDSVAAGVSPAFNRSSGRHGRLCIFFSSLVIGENSSAYLPRLYEAAQEMAEV